MRREHSESVVKRRCGEVGVVKFAFPELNGLATLCETLKKAKHSAHPAIERKVRSLSKMRVDL